MTQTCDVTGPSPQTLLGLEGLVAHGPFPWSKGKEISEKSVGIYVIIATHAN
ncbi:MAG: hypothetical protein AAYR33_03295 [Acetobacteraceae bacterium]